MTKDEVPSFVWDRLSKMDRNKDGAVSKGEFEDGMKDRMSHSKGPEEKKPEAKQGGKKKGKGKRAKNKKTEFATVSLAGIGT